jgi:hypothetical protein
VISALIHASAQAVNKNSVGTIWAGSENLGYLCANSLRLIKTRWEPQYRDTSIPGVDSTKIGIGSLRRLDEKEREEERKPGKRKKFRGLYVDEDDLPTIDDVKNYSGSSFQDEEMDTSTLEKKVDLFYNEKELSQVSLDVSPTVSGCLKEEVRTRSRGTSEEKPAIHIARCQLRYFTLYSFWIDGWQQQQ